jgi:hypothetical protein
MHRLCMRRCIRHGRAHPSRHTTRSRRRQRPETATNGLPRAHLLRGFRHRRRILHSACSDSALRQQLLLHHHTDFLRRELVPLVLYPGSSGSVREQPVSGGPANICQGRREWLLPLLRIHLDGRQDHFHAQEIRVVAPWLRGCAVRASLS